MFTPKMQFGRWNNTEDAPADWLKKATSASFDGAMPNMGVVEIPGGSPIVVKIVQDSITEGGSRLITWCWEYWRSIHEEIMTHRALSRNSASSRAIPAQRMREWILAKPAIPVYWGMNQRGMQATEELSPDEIEAAREWWLGSLTLMAMRHEQGEKMGLHKQIVNRCIQPWMTMSVVVSATNDGHSNLFHLRKHKAAEPHFQCIAGLAWELYHNHKPTFVPVGGWHLPYVDDTRVGVDMAKKISTARCARVSYLTHEGKRDVEKDLELHDMLAATASLGAEPMHASPFEHPARAVGERKRIGNFEGWRQYRKYFVNEAGPDSTIDRCNECGCWALRHVRGCSQTFGEDEYRAERE